jgi:D-alanine-D-alanine ligase
VKRLRVAVVYGGRSGEHEVSLASAAAVIANLDRQRYEPIAIRIEKDGRWVLADRPPSAASAADVIDQMRREGGRLRGGREVVLPARPGQDTLYVIERQRESAGDGEPVTTLHGLGLDVVFPFLLATRRACPVVPRSCSSAPIKHPPSAMVRPSLAQSAAT